MKNCAGCGIAKDESEFYSNVSRPDKKDCYCKKCRKQIAVEHRKKNINKDRIAKRLNHYDIDKHQFYALLENQGFRCAICNVQLNPTERSTQIDHDHQTGKIRGILCANCNLALGRLENKIKDGWHKKAAHYLGIEI